MRGTLGSTHRASIIDMIVDHHLGSRSPRRLSVPATVTVADEACPYVTIAPSCAFRWIAVVVDRDWGTEIAKDVKKA